MKSSHNYSLEYSSFIRDNKLEKDGYNLDQLVIDTNEFAQRVRAIQVNFQGPDYFGLESNFSDLKSLLQQITLELIHYQPDLEQFRIDKEVDHLETGLNQVLEPYKADSERIALLVSDLGNYIELYRKSVIEAGKMESFLLKEILEIHLNNLENAHWVFSMFSKY